MATASTQQQRSNNLAAAASANPATVTTWQQWQVAICWQYGNGVDCGLFPKMGFTVFQFYILIFRWLLELPISDIPHSVENIPISMGWTLNHFVIFGLYWQFNCSCLASKLRACRAGLKPLR
jgi:hypothetical protein